MLRLTFSASRISVRNFVLLLTFVVMSANRPVSAVIWRDDLTDAEVREPPAPKRESVSPKPT